MSEVQHGKPQPTDDRERRAAASATSRSEPESAGLSGGEPVGAAKTGTSATDGNGTNGTVVDVEAHAADDVRRPLSVSARMGRLQFHNSGKFRVLQLADIQDGPKISKDTIRLIEASLDAARPDLVIFTGNQIAGYDPAYAATFRQRRWETQSDGGTMRRNGGGRREGELGKTRELARKAMAQFLEPLIVRGVPFAVTYGNHDFQCGLDVAELDELYRAFPGCLNIVPAEGESASDGTVSAEIAPAISGLPDQRILPCEPGTFALPVMDVDHTRNVMALVLVNSGDYARNGGYGSPSAEALAFLETAPEWLHTKAMVFQHMPVPQYYGLLSLAAPTAPGAIQGYRAYESEYYVMDERKMQPGSYLGEGISCPDHDCGEFETMRMTGRYFGIVAGHDHRNGFVGELSGSELGGSELGGSGLSGSGEPGRPYGDSDDGHRMMLVATPTCGFGSYGPAGEKRAARLFEFDIRHPHHPRTQLLEFGELIGKPSSRKAYSYDIADVKSDSKGMNLLRKKSLWTSFVKLFSR